MSPLVFDPSVKKEGRVILDPLVEGSWHGRIVGYNPQGVFIVEKANVGFLRTDFDTRLVPWESVTDIKLETVYSIRKLARAIVFLAIGLFVCFGLWFLRLVWNLNPLVRLAAFLPLGVFCLLGARRTQLSISEGGTEYIWVSDIFGPRRKQVARDLARLLQRCGECGFDLRGNPQATICPECGSPIEGLDGLLRRR